MRTATVLLFLLGCEDTTKESDLQDEDTGQIEDDEQDSSIEDTAEEDTEADLPEEMETADYTVDATDSETWVYFDLATGSEVVPDTPEDSLDWDLKFQRYEIAVNGGVSGTGNVQVLIGSGLYDTYDDVEDLADGDWITDSEDADADGKPEYAFQDWFNYDLSTHVLSPADIVYFVQSTGGDIYKFRVLYYYNADGISGHMSIEFDPITVEEEK